MKAAEDALENGGEAEFVGFLPCEGGFLVFEVFEGAEGYVCIGVLSRPGCGCGHDGIDSLVDAQLDEFGDAGAAPCGGDELFEEFEFRRGGGLEFIDVGF